MEKIKVYGYCRVSSRDQIDKGGFDRQEKMIKSFAKNNNYLIEGIFKEKGIAGKKGIVDRPEFKEMLGAILSNGVKIILVERLDRLAREYRIQEEILIYLASRGIDLISVDSGENITKEINNDPMKKAIIQMQGIFSELDKSLIVKKMRDGRELKKLKTGKCEGRHYFGEFDGKEKEIVQKIIYLRRKNRGQIKRMSYQKIAKKLNEDKLKTKLLKEWTSMAVFNILNLKRIAKKKKRKKKN